MKRNAKTKRVPSLSAEELFLVRQYVREGATEDRLGRAARRAHMTEQHARTLLKRPHVQAELALQKQILRIEQAKIDAADINRSVEEDDVLCRETERKAMRKLNVLIDADPKDLKAAHMIQMQVLKLALVVSGTIRDGRTERLLPPDGAGGGEGGQSSQVPGSFFERGMIDASDAAPLFGEAESAPGIRDQGSGIREEQPASAPEVAPVAVEGSEPLEVLEVKVKRKSSAR